MPRNLVRTLEKHDDARSARRWMAALPLVVDELARRWSLDLERPFQPGGSASWVAPCENAVGERLVLKIGWPHDEALHEADGLRAWNGDGVVCVLDSLVIAETSALLLEACEPGNRSQALRGRPDLRPPSEKHDEVVGALVEDAIAGSSSDMGRSSRTHRADTSENALTQT